MEAGNANIVILEQSIADILKVPYPEIVFVPQETFDKNDVTIANQKAMIPI